MWLLICLVIKNVIELFFRGRKLNISVVFTRESYLAVPKYIRLNSTNYSVMKILNKRELQQIAFNHSSGTDFQDIFIKSVLQNPILFGYWYYSSIT